VSEEIDDHIKGYSVVLRRMSFPGDGDVLASITEVSHHAATLQVPATCSRAFVSTVVTV